MQSPSGLQLVNKFPEFHGNRRFITALTSVRHLSLSWARPIQSIYPHSTSWRSILILSTHLRLGLPSGLLPSGFPPRRYTPPLVTHTRHIPSTSHSYRFYHSRNIGWGVQIIYQQKILGLSWRKRIDVGVYKIKKRTKGLTRIFSYKKC